MSTDQKHSPTLPPGGVRAPASPGRKQRGEEAGQPRFQINWLLLAATLVAAAILVPTAHFWHAHQVRLNGAAFLDRAHELEQQGQWAEAAENLHRYYRLFPEGPETDSVRVRMAENFDRGASTPLEKARAVQLLSQAFGLAPNRFDLRLRQAELEFERRDYVPALLHAQEVLKHNPESPVALRLQAQCTYWTKRTSPEFADSGVEKFYLDALKYAADPDDKIALSVQLAHIYREVLAKLTTAPIEGGKPYTQLADERIDGMVQEHPDFVNSWLERYRYRRNYRQAGADEDLDRALELDKDRRHVVLCLHAGDRALTRQQPDDALKYFQRVGILAPAEYRGYQGQAAVYSQKRDAARAIEILKEGVKKVPLYESFRLQILLGEALLRDGRVDELPELLKTLDRQNAALAARTLGPYDGPELDRRSATALMLRGKWLMAKGEYGAAASEFRRALAGKPGLADDEADRSATRTEIYLMLGRCFVLKSDWDQAAVAFNEAVALAPNALEPKLAAAHAWQLVGRLDEAIRLYREAAAAPAAPDVAWLGLVEARIRQFASLAEEDRDWEEVEKTISAGLKAHPNSLSLKLLEAQVADLRGETGKTLELLEQTHAAQPDSPRITERLMLAYEAAQRGADAERVLQEFERRFQGKDPDAAIGPVLLRSTLYQRRGQTEQAEKLLRAHLDNVSPKLQTELKFRLALMILRSGRVDEARRELSRLAASAAAPPSLLPLVSDLALQARDFTELEQWEGKLREQEGDSGTLWRYYRAERLFAASTDVRDSRSQEAQRLSDEILRLRPSWSAGFVLSGRLALRRGDSATAINAYQQAINLGASQPAVFEQLTTLLYKANRLTEAEQYMARLLNTSKVSQRLVDVAIPLHMRQGNLERAVELAQQNVKNHPDDAVAQVWLGQALMSQQKTKEAEAAFRRAVELRPNEVQAWQSLLAFYIRTDQTGPARETLLRLADADQLPNQNRVFALARGYEALGDRDQARSYYQQAVEASPNDPTVRQSAANFFILENLAEAEKHQQRLMELSPDSDDARRGMIAILLSHGDNRSLDRADKLVEGKKGRTINSQLDPRDQRLKAMICIQRGGVKGRTEARRLLEDLVLREQALPSDRLSLAYLLETDGHLRAASDQLFNVARRAQASPLELAKYIELLLRHARAAEVGPWMDRLIKAAPDAYQTVSLRTRWLAAIQRRDDAQPLIEAFLAQRLAQAKNDPEKLQAILAVGRLYEQAELDEGAERCYREFARQTPKGYVALANWLAAHGRVGEAVSLCIEAKSSDTSLQPALSLARALILGQASQTDIDRAESVISQAIASDPRSADLIFSVATLRFLSGRKDEAATLLRKAIALDPKHTMARNNLALLLAESPDGRKEALQHIDEAIVTAGRAVELLDTKGMVLLRENKPDRLSEAIDLLREAGLRPGADPRHMFHLSLAYNKAGKINDARDALKRSLERSLDERLLTPDERQLLVQLKKDLNF